MRRGGCDLQAYNEMATWLNAQGEWVKSRQIRIDPPPSLSDSLAHSLYILQCALLPDRPTLLEDV